MFFIYIFIENLENTIVNTAENFEFFILIKYFFFNSCNVIKMGALHVVIFHENGSKYLMLKANSL